MLPVFGIAVVILWGIGIVHSQDWLVGIAAVTTALILPLRSPMQIFQFLAIPPTCCPPLEGP